MHRRDVVALNKALAAYKKLSPKARAAKDFPLVHALFALATFVAVGGKVLARLSVASRSAIRFSIHDAQMCGA
jgi:hypothetical protein